MRVFKLPPRPPPPPVDDGKKAASRRGRTSRARGRRFEKSTAEDIRAALNAHPEDVKLVSTSRWAGGGKDIIVHHALRARWPLHVECKDHKTLAVPAWIKQAEEAAVKENAGLEPIVVFKLAGNGKKYVIVAFDYFLKEVVRERED
jgi:hypothetical protein